MVLVIFSVGKHSDYNYCEFYFNLPNFYEHYETYSRSLCSSLRYLRSTLKQPLTATSRNLKKKKRGKVFATKQYIKSKI